MKQPITKYRRFAFCAALGALMVAATISMSAQGTPMNGGQAAAPQGGQAAAAVSEDATASVHIAGGTIDVRYNTPHMRGRKIMGELVPYGQVWRTGANPATTLITSVPLKFGGLLVPAGTHTIYTVPSADTWQLIINNQTGQWGLTYNQDQDLGRTPMMKKALESPQEVMSISFENTTADATEMHVRWETTDVWVKVAKP
jgi:DUF2911 family protein